MCTALEGRVESLLQLLRGWTRDPGLTVASSGVSRGPRHPSFLVKAFWACAKHQAHHRWGGTQSPGPPRASWGQPRAWVAEQGIYLELPVAM